MIEIDAIDPAQLATVRGVLTDIDDTLSSAGKLTAPAYSALWRLREAGLTVAVVTGRPAGWCDHIARFWPVDAVIGENGGFYFHHDGGKLHRRFLHDEAQRREFRRRLDALRERIFAEVPGCALASDQAYREYDLAIDYCEDVPSLPADAVARIVAIFEQAGACAKVSSIHVNGWFGDFDKLTTTRLWARERLGLELEPEDAAFAFCGDSPNDEPMFAFFRHAFAMANVRRFLPSLRRLPAYVTRGESGEGFAEVVALLLRAWGDRPSGGSSPRIPRPEPPPVP